MQKNTHFYLLGLGGIGMSAIARLLKQAGHEVTGEDKNKSLLLDLLKNEGIQTNTQQEFLKNTTLVYSTAIKEDHPQMLKAKDKNLPCMHRAAVLNLLLEKFFSLLVAGTHGKTTTSSLLTHVLLEIGQDPSFALGGILKEKNTNAQLGQGKYFVAEADESDGSFVHLKKDAIILTNIEEEHLEYWKNKKNLMEGFQTFLKGTELVIYCKDDSNISSLQLKGFSYGEDESADVFCKNIRAHKETMIFDLHTKGSVYPNVILSLMGKHNVLNALAVFTLLDALGFDPKAVLKSFSSFHGVKRRLEFFRKDKMLTLIDDYAHHPTEIRSTLSSLTSIASKRRLIAIFQPHRSTRFKEFYNEFLKAFDSADIVIVTDIYEVGEKVSVNLLDFVERLGSEKCCYIPREELEYYLSQNLLPFDILITLGAGDLFQILPSLVPLQKSLKTAILFGGNSLEHEISILSAETFYKSLLQPPFQPVLFYLDKNRDWFECNSFALEKGQKLKKIDFIKRLLEMDLVIPSFHGPFGEDGTVQGFLKTLNIPFISADPLACALSMNKALAKRVVHSHGIKTARFLELYKEGFSREKVEKALEGFSYPLFVKPCSLGSSYGVFEVKEKKELFSLIDQAFTFEKTLVLEEKVFGEEIEVGLIGNAIVESGLIAKILTSGKVHTYSTKYGNEAISSEIPAILSKELEDEFIQLAKKIYQIFHFSSFARIDFFLSGKEIFFNEINPIPGMTKTSAFPLMFKKNEGDLDLLIEDLSSLALKKKGL